VGAQLITVEPVSITSDVASIETGDEASPIEDMALTTHVEKSAGLPNNDPNGIFNAVPNLDAGLDLKSYLVEMEVQLIQKALSQTDGNVSQAAKLLQTNRTTLVEKIRKYELS